MRRTHDSADDLNKCSIEHFDDRASGLKTHGLRPRLFLRHVIHAEELVVTEQQSVHYDTFWKWGAPASRRISHWRTPFLRASNRAAPSVVVRGPSSASRCSISRTTSVSSPAANELTFSWVPNL